MKRLLLLAIFLTACILLTVQPLTFALVATLPPCNDEHQSTLSECDLRGPVHTLETSEYSSAQEPVYHDFMTFSVDGKLTEMRYERESTTRDTVFTLDDDGLTVRKHRLESDGKQKYDELEIMSFDRAGHETELQERGSDGALWTRIEQAYDRLGYLLSTTSYSTLNDGSYSRTDYKYDAKGRLSEELTTLEPGNHTNGPIFYDYPSPNVEIERDMTSSYPRDSAEGSDVPTWNIVTTRDDAARPVQIVTTSPGGTGQWCEDCPQIGRVTMRYDRQGHLLDRIQYSAQAKIDHEDTYRYDERGQLLEKTVTLGNGQIRSHETKIYDVNGNLVSKTEADQVRDGMMTTQFRYEVDSYGNWTRTE